MCYNLVANTQRKLTTLFIKIAGIREMEDVGYHDYNKVEQGDSTYFAYEGIYESEPFGKEEITLDDLKAAIDLEEKPTFLEGTAKRLCALGVACTPGDTDIISSEIKQRYKSRIGEDCPRTILNWAKGQRTSVKNRKNNYDLCYALEMNRQETADFFKKHFLSIPFNYKDSIDAIFFYCLMRNRPYSAIKAMLEQAEAFHPTEDTAVHTTEIAKQICDIYDDEEFMLYLSEHCYNKEQQFQRARNEIVHLINKHHMSASELHFEITGFRYFDNCIRNRPPRDDRLPRTFTESLPTDRTFLDIIEGKKPETYETLRKTLVILLFYDYYVPFSKQNIDVDKSQIYDFYDEANKRLLNCGFVPFYEKNLFDAVILFCANSTKPLETFQIINEWRYKELEE